jgi:glycosyltransferase involved in cell wall biosynthesis
MRIAVVVAGGFDPSGRERVIPALLWLVERLARAHEIHVYVLRYLEREQSYPLLGATVHDLGRPEGLRRQYAALLRAMRRDGPFDIMHAHWALPAGLAGSLVARRLHIPSVVVMDSGEFAAVPDLDYGLQLRRRQRVAVATTVRLASRVVVCSHFQERLARKHGALPEVIPIGVDTSVFTPGAPASGPPWRLLHVANLNKIKDHPMLLESLRQLVERVPDVHLDCVGLDTLGGSIQDLARRLGVDRNITFHGFQPTDALVALYQRAHLFVLTSRHEAGGIAALEAAASGVPVAGTAVGHLADWTPDRALTVAPGDARALANVLADLLADRAKRQDMAAAARAWALGHDADWTALQFARLYRNLVHD